MRLREGCAREENARSLFSSLFFHFSQKNLKALYRRAVAREKIRETEAAMVRAFALGESL